MATKNLTIKLPDQPAENQSGDATLPPTGESLVNESAEGDQEQEEDQDKGPGQQSLDPQIVIDRLRAQRTNLQAELRETKTRAKEAERKLKALGKEARQMRMFDTILNGMAASGQLNLGVLDRTKMAQLMQHAAGLAQVAEKQAADSGF